MKETIFTKKNPTPNKFKVGLMSIMGVQLRADNSYPAIDAENTRLFTSTYLFNVSSI